MRVGRLLSSEGTPSVGRVLEDHIELVDLGPFKDLSEVLAASDVRKAVQGLRATGQSILLPEAKLLPPIDSQEVWAAGVTYRRSQTARMEESETAASCYDRVYQADRPEIFLKPHRIESVAAANHCAYAVTPVGMCRNLNWPWYSRPGWKSLATPLAMT